MSRSTEWVLGETLETGDKILLPSAQRVLKLGSERVGLDDKREFNVRATGGTSRLTVVIEDRKQYLKAR